jgi:hypothetical protein
MIIEGKKYYCVWDTDLYNNGGSEDCYQFVYDDYCTRKDKKCVPIEGVTLGENEKCELTIDESTSFLKCRKTFKKGCEEYNDKTECINAPKSNTEQCYYSGGCRRLFIDEKCILNNEGECVENGNGKLASDEICSYMSLIGGGYDLSSCKARKKECYDIKNEQICNNYALEKKNCFVNPNNNQCFYNLKCIPFWLNILYTRDLITCYEWLLLMPLDAYTIEGVLGGNPAIFLRVVENINPYVESNDIKDKIQYVKEYHAKLHKNPKLIPALEGI